jgi:hypothetical protein
MGKLFNRARMTVSGTPGTGTITLLAATTGFQSFASAGVANSNVVSYLIEDGTSWEYGQGTYTSAGTTLARTTIQGSSAGGTTAISVTSNAIVSVTALAADIPSVAGQYPGTTTNDNASTGNIGEYVETFIDTGAVGAITLTDSTEGHFGSVALGAGDWDVVFDSVFSPGSTTSVFYFIASLNTSDTSDFGGKGCVVRNYPAAGQVIGAVNENVKMGPKRFSLSASGSVYGLGFAHFTGSCKLQGWLRARRVR